MAGYFIALHRMLRLKVALKATVSSIEFQDLKLGKKDRASAHIKDAKFWQRVYLVLRSVWPAMQVLRLADRNTPGMDKLYYLVRRTEQSLTDSMKYFADSDLFGGDDEVDESDEDKSLDEDEIEEEDSSKEDDTSDADQEEMDDAGNTESDKRMYFGANEWDSYVQRSGP
jgi:hypothetical protein